jgi:tetratricopeptide (TPR) repeat protein
MQPFRLSSPLHAAPISSAQAKDQHRERLSAYRASTWTLSFSKVEQADPAAADLLRVCAFLHPDAIPETILTEGAAALGPQLQEVATEPLLLNEAIQLLRRYSLVKRDAEARLLNMHRLVQVVLKESLDEATQQMWAERTVRAVAATFPAAVDRGPVEITSWPGYEQCLPHVQSCLELIDHYGFSFPEVVHLLNQAGDYLWKRARYGQALSLLQRALTIREQVLGNAHPDVAHTLHHLAQLYEMQGKSEQAQIFYQRALAIRENVLGAEHPYTVATREALDRIQQASQEKFSSAP